jgi:hypothetical protein
MRRKCEKASASGGVTSSTLCASSLGTKVSATNKSRMRHVKGEDENLKQRPRCDTRPYKTQLELEQLGISGKNLRANALGLFHLGALSGLLRCVSSPCPSVCYLCSGK